MSFTATYKITDSVLHTRSSLDGLIESTSIPTVGAYNFGQIMILDYTVGRNLLLDWKPRISGDCRAIATTAFGDVFYWEPGEGIRFLEVQAVNVINACDTCDSFLDDFLQSNEVMKTFLRKKQFEDLYNLKGPLTYHNAFILKPWQMLGGIEKPSKFDIGNCSVYLSLVGQTLKQTGLLS